MVTKLCPKCNAPIIEQEGKLVCSLCDAYYGDASMLALEKDPKDFFKNVSWDRLKEINHNLVGSVFMLDHDYKNGSKYDYAEHINVCLSNGTSYVRYDSETRPYQHRYSTKHWYGVAKIYTDTGWGDANHLPIDPGLIGVTDTGEVQASFQKTTEYLKEILGETKIKNIVKVCVEKRIFLGVSTTGKIIVSNPFLCFALDSNKEVDMEQYAELVQKIKNFPPVEKVVCDGHHRFAITTEGTLLPICNCDENSLLWEETNVEDVVVGYSGYQGNLKAVLKKDGSVALYKGWSKIETDLCNIVQIASDKFYGRKYTEAIQFLRSDGKMFVWYGEKIAEVEPRYGSPLEERIAVETVLALVPKGYISADGIVYKYCTRNTDRMSAGKPQYRMFEDIDTLEEQWRMRKEAYQDYIPKIKQKMQDLQHEMCQLKSEIRPFGFIFKAKETKHLKERHQIAKDQYSGWQCELARISTAAAKVEHTGPVYYPSSHHTSPTPYQKDKSVIGSAVVGGIIAGPAGAVVGALHAVDKNNKKK